MIQALQNEAHTEVVSEKSITQTRQRKVEKKEETMEDLKQTQKNKSDEGANRI